MVSMVRNTIYLEHILENDMITETDRRATMRELETKVQVRLAQVETDLKVKPVRPGRTKLIKT